MSTIWDDFIHSIFLSEPVAASGMDMDRDESEDSYEEMEEARLRDLEERDAFAGRLKDKDKEKTRQVMSKTEKKVSLVPEVIKTFAPARLT